MSGQGKVNGFSIFEDRLKLKYSVYVYFQDTFILCILIDYVQWEMDLPCEGLACCIFLRNMSYTVHIL